MILPTIKDASDRIREKIGKKLTQIKTGVERSNKVFVLKECWEILIVERLFRF